MHMIRAKRHYGATQHQQDQNPYHTALPRYHTLGSLLNLSV